MERHWATPAHEQGEGHKEYEADIDELPTTIGVFKDVVEEWE